MKYTPLDVIAQQKGVHGKSDDYVKQILAAQEESIFKKIRADISDCLIESNPAPFNITVEPPLTYNSMSYAHLMSQQYSIIANPSSLESAIIRGSGFSTKNPKVLSEMSLRLLKRARDDYEVNGYAIGTYYNQVTGQRCGLGSLDFAWRQENNLSRYSHDARNNDVLGHALSFISRVAQERYQRPIHVVNDNLGHDATLECFEFAIKELEGTLEPEEPQYVRP